MIKNGLVLNYDKLVWFGSKFSVNGLVYLNGFINFKQFGLLFIMNKWFGLVSRPRTGTGTEPGPSLLTSPASAPHTGP